jgi:hypothetical protein
LTYEILTLQHPFPRLRYVGRALEVWEDLSQQVPSLNHQCRSDHKTDILWPTKEMLCLEKISIVVLHKILLATGINPLYGNMIR